MVEIIYIDKRTGTQINPNNIVKNTSEGITIYEDGIWKFIAAERIQKADDNTATVFITDDGKTYSAEQTIVTSPILPKASSDVTDVFYSYYFGLTEAAFEKRLFQENSGYLSDPIKVSKGKTYNLSVSYEQPDKTSIEFYIVDGIDIIPILPKGITAVKNERQFLDQDLLFMPAGKVSYYRNFKKTDSPAPDNSSLITADYEAFAFAQNYIPKSNEVRIKVILRFYSGAKKPPIIHNLLLQRKD